MVVYKIKTTKNNRSVFDWICEQPLQVTSPEMAGEVITAEFTHNATQEKAFKVALMKIINYIDVNGVKQNVFDFLEQVLADQYMFGSESQQTKTNIGTSYVDIFPAAINGNPIPVDTTGFTKLAVQLFWNKNGGASAHDFRIVNDANISQVIYEKTNITTTITEDFNVALNGTFTNFTGKLRIQGKAGNATDDPIFLGLRLYLRR